MLSEDELAELVRRRPDLGGKDWPQICVALLMHERLEYIARKRKGVAPTSGPSLSLRVI